MAWRYYIPEYGQTSDDAKEIEVNPWSVIIDAESAAGAAAEMQWSKDSCDRDFGDGPDIVVIDVDGHETRFATQAELAVRHTVRRT